MTQLRLSMNLAEYSRLDAVSLGQLVNSGDVLPQELAELALSSIEKLNPTLNAVIETYPERATGAGDEPPAKSALCGVPMLLKDTGATESGKRQGCGSRIGQGYIADTDAYLTQSYRRAGLNILGRTTMPELALAATTESALYGATLNPWDINRSAGGSSGGAAVAVASGMVPVAHGTDTGGSIRIPAACCGLVGLKPSRGRVDHGPLLDDTLYGGLNTQHVITRSVRDTATILAISRPDQTFSNQSVTPFATALSYEQTLATPKRIAFTADTYTGVPVEPGMWSAVQEVALSLVAMGHTVEEDSPNLDGESYAMADGIVWTYSTAREIRRLAMQTGLTIDAQHLERPALEAYELAQSLCLDDWFSAMETYHHMRQTVGSFFTEYDFLLTPTVASVAPQLGTLASNRDISYEEFMTITANFCPHTAPFNVTGQPAISLPLCMGTEGLPIGIQIVARFGDEAGLIQLALQLEEAFPWEGRIPPLHISRVTQ